MQYQIPRIMIAGTGSGCGKTTVTCALMKAFSDKGLKVGAFKCGPDYIDPMFHSRILGTPSTNLDSFFFSENTLNYLLVKNGREHGINIIEGVMGFYDGLGVFSPQASSYETARITGTPAILVLNAKGAALSILAEIHGFLTFMPENLISGVILNNCSPMTWPLFAKTITEHFEAKIKPLGYLPSIPDCAMESRHLGLVTAQEVDDFEQKIERLGKQATDSIDLNGILQIASNTAAVRYEKISVPKFSEKVRIAYAKDKAFCFYYHDNLDLLEEMGAELLPFSPLTDHAVPENVQGLYLGGGYPELYAKELSENTAMKKSIHKALTNGLPCIAECGGFMYLQKELDGYLMAGLLPGECYNNKKLTRFGYLRLKANHDNMLCSAKDEITAHEFHYWDCTENGNAFTAEKNSGRRWDCVFANNHLYAGFPHFHFYSNPNFAVNFYKTCLRYKEKQHA